MTHLRVLLVLHELLKRHFHCNPRILKYKPRRRRYAGDYDGDALTIHVPMTPEAIEEAKKKLLPSEHIFDYRKGIAGVLGMTRVTVLIKDLSC